MANKAKALAVKAVGLAIQESLGVKSSPNLSLKAKKGKVVEPKLRDMTVAQYDNASEARLAIYVPDEAKRNLIEEFATLAMDQQMADHDHQLDRETRLAQINALAAKIWPTGKVSYNEYGAIALYLKGRNEYAYKCLIAAVKALPGMKGKLPAADGSKKSGKRKASPVTWVNVLAREFAKVTARMAKVPKDDVDSDALRRAVRAISEASAAVAAMEKRIKAA